MARKRPSSACGWGLDANAYRCIHDLVLPVQGGTTQIDHVLVSVYGIFVIETKNMKGWIFNDERSPQWIRQRAARTPRWGHLSKMRVKLRISRRTVAKYRIALGIRRLKTEHRKPGQTPETIRRCSLPGAMKLRYARSPLSPEARRRIAEGQHRHWAAWKAGQTA